MSVEIRVPPLGESVVEATVGSWLKQAGEPVEKDEVLVELETDKITVEVAAPRSGVLSRIEKNEGDTVGLNDLLGSIEENAAAGAAAGEGDAVEAVPQESPVPEAAEAAAAAAESAAEAGRAGSGREGATQTSPAARAVAAEHGVDLAQVAGSGPNGRVTKEDVLQVVEKRQRSEAPAPQKQAPAAAPAPAASTPAPAPSADGRRESRERMSRRRQTIARRLVEAQQTTA